ncbi:MAG: NAD(P)H-quinone oxidoreductase [Desulfobacterales bacterium]|nr:MAG: NAD(P)H-quinone oxidoreductase [Desulfobacterales bacterium]
MKAIVVKKSDKEPVLVWETVPDVAHGPEEVLVDIKATAVNRADLLQAMGAYPPPPGESEIIGLEMAGVVAAVGDAVEGWQIGDRVAGLLPGGGYAQQVAVHSQMLIRLPDSWSFAEGAAIPEVWLTAFSNLFLEGDLKSGETVMLHAGASGVGTAGIQMARAAGAVVYVTAGNQAKLEACRELGARLAINYKTQDFFKEAMDDTGGEGIDLILDPVGGPYLNQNLNLLKTNGRLVVIGLLGGGTADLNLGTILGKSLRIIATRLRARPLNQKIFITQKFKERFWPLVEEGRLKPVIDKIFPITEAQAAHAHVRQDRNIGKVILEVKV